MQINDLNWEKTIAFKETTQTHQGQLCQQMNMFISSIGLGDWFIPIMPVIKFTVILAMRRNLNDSKINK